MIFLFAICQKKLVFKKPKQLVLFHRKKMTTNKFPVDERYTKRQKVLTAIAQDVVNSDDNDLDMDTIRICRIIDDQESQENPRSEISVIAIRALGETIRNTLLEINQIREQNRERRHKELLDVLNSVINNEAHQFVQTQHPYQKDIELQQNLSDHCIVEDAIGDTTENNHSVKATENVKTSSVNVSRKQVCQKTAVIAVSCPKQNTKKKETNSIGDIQLMRANMLKMQRKKMEDRVRKKRDCLQFKEF